MQPTEGPRFACFLAAKNSIDEREKDGRVRGALAAELRPLSGERRDPLAALADAAPEAARDA